MSPLRTEARDAMLTHLEILGNPSALHRAGQRAKAYLEDAREELARAVGAHPTEVVFTSGGSEANTIAVRGAVLARPERRRALISAIEHPSVLGHRDWGAEEIPVTRDGLVDVPALAATVDTRVAVVSVMWVNNETGIIQPLEEIREVAGNSGAWLHSDAVQALGHVPVDFKASGLDLLSLAAHKIGGPVGIGALVLRRGVEPKATGVGGGQERDIRSGTGTVALAAGFAAAATAAIADLEREIERLGELQDRIVRLVIDCGGVVNTLAAPHAPHIVNVTFPGLRAGDLLFLLDTADVAASVGSACRAGVHQPSEVMLAMGRDADLAAATVRFSIGHTTTDDDVTRLEAVLPEFVDRAQRAF